MIKIIDGVGEKEHVTAENVALSQIGTIGGDTYILEAGNNLGYQIISANEVDIKDGVFMVQGRRGCVIPGSVERCSIRTGSQGKKRNDLICVKYEKNTESKVETFTLEVVEGQEGASGIDPVLTTGDINAGAALHYAPLYRVKINGITIDAVEQMAKTYKTGEKVKEQIDKEIDELKNGIKENQKKISEKMTICSGQFATLNEFVQFVTKAPGMTTSGRFKDTGGWTPEANWWRFWAAAQNPTGHSSSVDIEVLLASERDLYIGYVSGTNNFSAKWNKVFGPTDYYTLGSAGGISCHVWSSGQTVTVEVNGGLTQNIDAWKTLRIGTLPIRLRPPMNLIFPVAGIASQHGACIAISTNGAVEVANRSNNVITIRDLEIFTACTYVTPE